MIEYKSEIIKFKEKYTGCLIYYSVETTGKLNINSSPEFRSKSDALEWCKNIIDKQLQNLDK